MRTPSTVLPLLCAALVSGCAGPRIALAPELQAEGTQELPVSTERRSSGGLLNGRSAGVLRFGPHEAEWEREPTEEHRRDPNGDGSCWTRRAVRFVLRTPGLPPRSVQCEERMEGTYRTDAKLFGVSVADDEAVHRVQCQLPEGTLSLSDEGSESGWLRGGLEVQGLRLSLEPVTPQGSSVPFPAGYTVLDGARAVAAVHTLHSTKPRTVWVAPALTGPTRSAAAVASAALLLVGGGGGQSCAELVAR